jgi:hypothetical protein
MFEKCDLQKERGFRELLLKNEEDALLLAKLVNAGIEQERSLIENAKHRLANQVCSFSALLFGWLEYIEI